MKKNVILFGSLFLLIALAILVICFPFKRESNKYSVNVELTNVPTNNLVRVSLTNWDTEE